MRRGRLLGTSVIALAVMTLICAACVDLGNLANPDPDMTPEGGAVPCRADTCGAHGKCDDTSGMPLCVCDKNYRGTTCGDCTDGFHLVGGACTPRCTPTSCPARSTCNDTTATPTCACSIGYTTKGTSCLWTETFVDPGFTGTPAKAWSFTATAKLSSSGGMIDPGTAQLSCGDLFTQVAESTATQTVMMPKLAESEPLAIVIDANQSPNIPRMLRFGTDTWSAFPPTTTMTGTTEKYRACLGDAAYGGAIAMSFGLSCNNAGAGLPTNWLLDHADIVTAPDCPAPGIVKSGDFEDAASWTLTGGGEIVSGAGVGGSAAGHFLKALLGGGTARLSTLMSIPSSMVGPAIDFSQHGGLNSELEIDFAELPRARISVSQAFSLAHICLPRWARGATGALSFQPPADALTSEVFLDDIKLVSDPACDALAIVDPGFEGGAVTGWALGTVAGATASIDRTAGVAHGGAAALRLLSSSTCAMATATQFVAVPKLPAGQGPSLRFWYRTEGTLTTSHVLKVGSLTVPAATAFTQRTVCIPAHPSSPAMQVISIYRDGAPCASNVADVSLIVDDLDIIGDAACPIPP